MALLLNAGDTVSRSYSYTQPSPLHPSQPQGCGDMTGNLASTEQGAVNSSDGSDQAYDSRLAQIRSQYIPCSAETIYMVACTEYPVQNYMSFYDANKAYLSRTSGIPITQARQFTTPVDSAYMRITMFHSKDGQIYPYIVGAKIMLNSGSTPLSYEPYGYKIPISSANTTTPVYLGEVETTRKIKKLVLTRDETIDKADNCFRIPLPLSSGSIPNVVSTHLQYKAGWELRSGATGICTSTTYYGTNYKYLLIRCDEIATTTADFKSYLAAQYAAGTPVTVWYVLAEPETAIVNEPIRKIGDYADEVSNVSIPVTAGGDTLSVGTTVQPSEVTVNYKGWHPVQSVHERNNGAWT